MTNEELVALIQAGVDVQKNMALLLEQCRGFIYSIAKKYPRSPAIELEDLIQEGYLGVMKAAESYKDQGYEFISYAKYHIQKRIRRNALEPCLNSVRIPSEMFSWVGKYRKYGAAYHIENGDYPSDEEAIEHLGITESQFQQMKRIFMLNSFVELDAPVPGTEIDTYGDVIPDDTNVEETALDAIYREECSVVLLNCIESLGDKNAMIILERYFENMSLQEIADKHNLTNGRIGQIEQQCLRLLREMDAIKALRDKYDYRSAGLKGTGFSTWKDTGESSVECAVRKKMEIEARHNENLKKLEDELNSSLEDLKAQLLGCERERREQIEQMFNRPYDELIPHILALPEKAREMFVMSFVLGMRNSDIAKQQNVVWNAVKSGKNYAVLKLNQALAV